MTARKISFNYLGMSIQKLFFGQPVLLLKVVRDNVLLRSPRPTAVLVTEYASLHRFDRVTTISNSAGGVFSQLLVKF